MLAMGATGCRSAKPALNGAGAATSEVQSELKMTKMRSQSFTENGLEWELEAPFGEVFSRRNLMRLKMLTVQLFDKGQKSTDITARQGIMSTGPQTMIDGNHDQSLFGLKLEPGDMHLSGDVVMISTDGSKLTTDWVHYHKKTDTVTSTAPVKVERQDSITHGVGMEASADMSRLHIFNETLLIPEKKN